MPTSNLNVHSRPECSFANTVPPSAGVAQRIRIATCLVAVLAALLWITPSRSQETSLQQYEVELIVFRTTNPTGSKEDWTLAESRAKSAVLPTREGDEPTAPGTPVAVAPSAGYESSFQPLESARFRLTSVEGSLKRSRNYQVLAHLGWTQPGFALDSPRPLDIVNLVSSTTNLSGTVTLTRGRYLRMVLDLTWQAPDGQHYVLREQRRMKSGDKHYFDHPYFGVVALVTPKQS